MWVTGYRFGGFFYFDGQNFTHYYELTNGDLLKGVTNLVADSEGIWFKANIEGASGLVNGQFVSFRNGEFQNHSQYFPEGTEAFCLDSQNNLWVAYNGKLYLYNSETMQADVTIDLPSGFSENVLTYFIDSQDRHWITIGNTVLSYSDSRWETYPTPNWVFEYFESESGAISMSINRMYGFFNGEDIHLSIIHI